MTRQVPQRIMLDPAAGRSLRVYSPEHDLTTALRALRGLGRNAPVIDPIVLLPDFHCKPDLETPSSSVVVTRQRFSLSLSSPSQNCGMCLVVTPLFQDWFTDARIERCMQAFKRGLPDCGGGTVLNREDALQALQSGASWAVSAFGLPDAMRDFIEHSGNLLSADAVTSADIRAAVTDDGLSVARNRFARLGGGNHFLEMQVVEEVYDNAVAHAWGLQPGQVVIMFHTGSDALGAWLGRLYAHRARASARHRRYFFRKKIRRLLFARPWTGIPERMSYYLVLKPFRFIDPATPEGRKVRLSMDCAANFAFASRTVIVKRLEDALRKAVGSENLRVKLVYDCSHNSIYQEQVDGRDVWVHRHNACRAWPASKLQHHPVFVKTGQPVLLPGTSRTSSYVCAAQEGAAGTWYSVDHGLGAVTERLAPDPAPAGTGHTRCFGFESALSRDVPHCDDAAGRSALAVLQRADIVKPVVRLRPVATLKGPKQKIV